MFRLDIGENFFMEWMVKLIEQAAQGSSGCSTKGHGLVMGLGGSG